MIRDTIFFDLDGTLLPLDMDAFTAKYLALVKQHDFKAAIGRPLSSLVLNLAFKQMLKPNHPNQTNEQAFFASIEKQKKISRERIEPMFNLFYSKHFDELKSSATTEPLAAEVVQVLKMKGYRLVLATNPVFPRVATLKRIQWAGLNADDFEFITTYENSRYCKPHSDYYQDILNHLFLSANQCYMVGNNVKEDLCTVSLGFEAFLVTDYLIGDIRKAPICKKGNYSDLKSWAEQLPKI